MRQLNAPSPYMLLVIIIVVVVYEMRINGTAYYFLDNLNSPFVCQVFYHKLRGINRWKVTLGFFTKNKMNVSYCSVYRCSNILMKLEGVLQC